MGRRQLEVRGRGCGEDGHCRGSPEDQRQVERQTDGWRRHVSGTNAESGRRGRDTSGGAEAIEFVLVIVSGGGAPAVAVRATVCGAGGVGAALESERKHAGLAVCIAVLGVESWGGPHITRSLLTHRPPVYSIPRLVSQMRKLGPEHRRVTCWPHSTSDRAGIKTQGSQPSRVVGVPHRRRDPALTLAGAEAEQTVNVKVGRGAAPEHVV